MFWNKHYYDYPLDFMPRGEKDHSFCSTACSVSATMIVTVWMLKTCFGI